MTAYWDKPQTTPLQSLCITEDVLSHRSARPSDVPFLDHQYHPTMAAKLHPTAMVYPFICSQAFKYLGDVRCSVVSGGTAPVCPGYPG